LCLFYSCISTAVTWPNSLLDTEAHADCWQDGHVGESISSTSFGHVKLQYLGLGERKQSLLFLFQSSQGKMPLLLLCLKGQGRVIAIAKYVIVFYKNMNVFLKKFKFFYLIFLYIFSYCFVVLMLKIIFKK
jgi:hypothetical protein